ncbi:MAG: T9SS type A sorting domain-containing protein [Bacteroidales bacterium]|nr:T9SS type A sorting domain-containing protein [Bacteroidales bacterium]MCF8334269.1 T9SS type A sorting domain-containing protein [Bacteroidales bacterium]
MKLRLITIAFLIIPAFIIGQESDSITMEANYANDVYYSFENGEVKSEPRANWDLAFQTDPFSSSILINDGSGAILKTYPNGDTSDWNSLDTAGYSQWPAMYNHETDWQQSAFERFALGHPDYGWGIYNMNTHDVIGDSLYVLKMGNGSFKKIWIEKKISTENTYYFRYADLNGQNEQSVELDVKPYTDKNYVYYSLADGQVVDREPASDTWDILFTRYTAMIDGTTPYTVTGVLNNFNTGVAEYTSVAPEFEQWNMLDLDTSRSVIGYDWKEFDMGTFTYVVDDSTLFFATSHSGAIYKLRFTKFEGSSTGKVVFEVEEVSTADVEGVSGNQENVKVYPNPAKQYLNLEGSFDRQAVVRLYDLTGKLIVEQRLNGQHARVPVSDIRQGVYMLTIVQGSQTISQKVMIR